MGQADIIRAGRNKPPLHPLMTKVALLRDALVFVKCDRFIRARSDAGPTSDTQIVVHDDNTVLPFGDRIFRTGLDTGWIVAVPASFDPIYKFGLIIDPSRPVFVHRNQFDALGRPVFLLAGHLAGSAAPTKLFIDSKFKARHDILLQLH